MESKNAYRDMTKVQLKEIVKQLVKYPVPRVLREVFCRSEKESSNAKHVC